MNTNKTFKITKDTDVSLILEELKNGVKEFMTSDNYKNYLDFQSSLYQYSFNNCLLIAMQKPEASIVGSYAFWKKYNRYVNKGEKGIRILAPNTAKRKFNIPVYDDNKNPLLDDYGKPITKTVEKTVITGFRLVPVFDVSQTSGEPLPNILKELTGNSSASEILIEAIKNISEIPITFEEINDGSKGYYTPIENKIVIKDNMSKDQTAKTLIHEYAHSKLHKDLELYSANRGVAEIEAESIAYVVSKHFGLDTSEYSFGYVTSWSKGKDLDYLQDTLKTINYCSREIINEIEERLSAIYEKSLIVSKGNIRMMVEENGYVATDSIVNNILNLNKLDKGYGLKEILDLYNENLYISNDKMKYIKQIGDELKKQEKTINKIKDYELQL